MTGRPPAGRGRPAPLGRAFWRLWSASTLSNLADGVVKVSLPLVAVTLTDSPALVAGIGVAVTLPWLLFGYGSIWALYGVALFVATAETLYDTSAQSILPQVVPRERLSRANGRLQAAELTANEFVGPPLGGVLVATGIAVAFAAPAGLWAVAVGLLLLVQGQFRVLREHRTTIRADVAEGLRFLWRHRLLRTLAAMTGLFNLATNATFAVFVLYVVGSDSAMELSEAGYGLLFATIAAGSLLGALVADRVER